MAAPARLASLALLTLATAVACPAQRPEPVSPAVASVPAAGAADAGSQSESALLAAVGNARSPAEVNRLLTSALCDRAVRCGSIGASQRAECLKGADKSRLTLVWGNAPKLGTLDLVADGRMRFDASKTKNCVAAWLAESCHGPSTLPDLCYRTPAPVWLGPTVPPGGACSRWGECIDGICSAQPGCQGTCQARSKTAGPCGANQVCLDQDVCDEGKCRPRARLGEECRGDGQFCEEGLFCEGWLPENESIEWGYPEQKGHCARPKPAGEKCFTLSSRDICDPRLFCDWGDRSPTCRRRLPLGSECRWLYACADGLACVGLKLGGRSSTGANRIGVTASGRCEAMKDLGDACDPDTAVSGCPASMLCDPKSKSCLSHGHQGDACTSSWCPPDSTDCEPNGCFGGLYCEPKTHTCQPEHLPGESCVPEVRGKDDSPCFLADCDPKTRTCVPKCR